MKPMFSVIIPTLNEENFLPNLLESLVSQTVKDFETIVVDGSSKDATVTKAELFRKKLPKLDVVVSNKASLPLQRNLGATKARGDWFVFVDADSVFLPYSFERIKGYIHNDKPDVFTTWCKPDSNEKKDALLASLNNSMVETLRMIKRPFTPGPLTIIKQDIFSHIGGYDENHEYNEDFDLGLRLNDRGIDVTILRETLYIWSQRRFRQENKLKIAQQYIISILPVLVMKKSLKRMPGYEMGGRPDREIISKKQSFFKKSEEKLKSLVAELFE